MPMINKQPQYLAIDDRKMTVLEGSRIANYEERLEKKQFFDNFFQTSLCSGKSREY